MVPTQVANPRRAVVRTVFAGVVAFAAILPFIINAVGIDSALPAIAGILAVSGAITRVMALPSVNDWIAKYLPFLAPTSPDDTENAAQ